MPYGRRRMVAPLKSDKHEVTWSDLAIDASSVVAKTLVFGVQSADKNTSTECEIGSHVRSIYFEINFAAETITNPKVIHWAINVFKEGETSTIPSLYYQLDRSTIIKRGMEMLPKSVATVYKRVFVVRIPKKAQRISANTRFQFRYISTLAETVNVCGFAIYKEFY